MNPRRFLIAGGAVASALAGIVALAGDTPTEAQSGLPYKVRAPMVARDVAPTSTPTTVPTATPTSSPPTSVPTVAPTSLQFSGVTSYLDAIDYLHIVGLVTNYLSYNVEFVEIQARYYSASGALLDTDFTYARRSVIPSGEASPFEVTGKPPAGAIRWEIQIIDWSVQSFYALPVGLTATITNTFVDTIDYGHIVGTVKNNSATTWRFVEVHIALLKGGQILETDFTYARPTDLAPGQTGTFEATVSPHSGFDPVSFSGVQILIWVDADD